VRAYNVAEERIVRTFLEAIRTSILLVGPPRRQILERSHLIVHNGLVPHSRPKNAISSLAQDIEKLLEMLTLQNYLVTNL